MALAMQRMEGEAGHRVHRGGHCPAEGDLDL